jgi:hypothetical protein
MSQLHTLRVRRKLDGAPASVSEDKGKAADGAKAERESREETVSKAGGFANDPDDPTNPNEAIERHRRKLRP